MKLYSFRNGSIPESKYSEVGADPTVHIALGFDQRKVVSEAGSYANGPNPQGLSGAPLWLIYDESDIVDPLNPPIVAVVTEHRRQHKIILATDIAVVLEAIENVA